MLQPVLGELKALNLLTDWRRPKRHYRQRLENPPRHCKHKGVIKYPRSEVERAIREIVAFDLRPPILA